MNPSHTPVNRLMATLWAAFATSGLLCGGTCHVWQDSPTPTPPYDTWETAAQDIRTAVNYAVVNSIANVLVTNGTYDVTASNLVNGAVYVQSVEGAEQTIVQRTSGTFNIFMITHSGAVVDGFTIRNGVTTGVSLTAGTLRNCIVTNNTARNRGGVDASGPVWVQDCVIEGNSGGVGGSGTVGGIGIRHASAVVERCIIRNNTSGSGSSGGGVLISDGVLRNCLIYGNSGLNGGGLYVSGGSVQHCTVTLNTALTGSGGGLRQTGGTVVNCIIQRNASIPGKAVTDNISLTGGTFENNCAWPLAVGSGNFVDDPEFVAPVANNFRLVLGSPCIDAGQVLVSVPSDIEGSSRSVDGNGDSTVRPDVGAYELTAFDSGALRCGFVAAPSVGFDTLNTALAATVHGTNRTGLAYYWDFTANGSTDASGGVPTASASYVPGTYDVILVVSNAAGEAATLSRSGYIRVAPSEIHVAETGSGTYPYDTWAKATTNLQDAVDAGLATPTQASVVNVAEGTYRLAAEWLVDKGIRVRGVGAADKTVVRRSSTSTTTARMRVLRLSHEAAIVEGLTLTNGYTSVTSGTGAWIREGLLRNCLFVGNVSDNGSGGGFAIDAGTVSNCVVFANQARGGGGIMANGGLVTDCLVYGNATGKGGGANGGGGVSVSGGTLRNTLVYGHTHANTGAGINGTGTLINCTVVDNTNTTATVGGGIVLTGGSAVNVVAARNFRSGGTADDVRVADVSRYTYSCAPELTSGTGNITGTPHFRNPSLRDYSLLSDSPGINVGLYQSWMDTATDLAGNPRLKGVVDMGAYEVQGAAGTMILLR